MFDFNVILTWMRENQIITGLVATAIFSAMPDRLPYNAKAIPHWLWTWFYVATKTFLNLRRGDSTPPPIASQDDRKEKDVVKQPRLLNE
jgi:hypothetical protein